MADEEPGMTVGTVLEGKYRLDEVIGRGGMGVVYRATHLLLQKEVAVKLLLPELAADREIVSRMVREARTASATGHPNVVLVTDMGWAGGVPFLVMELLKGQSLGQRLRKRGPMSVSTAAQVITQVLDALEAVHAKGVVHRDLKPGNVMLAEGPRGKTVVKVLDFGISKVLEGENDLDKTKTGKVMGTPRHMAPEQALATDIDHRADLHATGSLLYTLLTARAPFGGPNTTATLARVLEGSFAPASSHVPDIPPGLDAIIAKALSVKRDDRYVDAAAMREALAPYLRPDAGKVAAPAAAEPGPPPVDINAPPTQGTLRPLTLRSAEPPPRPKFPTPARLELDVPKGWHAGQADRSPIAPPRKKSGAWWGWYVLVAVLLAGGLAGWRYRDKIKERFELGIVGGDDAGTETGENVLLLIDTTPRDAFIFVDGVQRYERPVEVPKSSEHIEIRVEADGFEPRVIEVQPTRTRRVSIILEKRKTKGDRKRR